MINNSLQAKYDKLVASLPARSAVAFSGGVDSSLLLRAALDADPGNIAIIADTPFLPRAELEEAVALARSLRADIEVLRVDVLARPDIAENGPERCYHCKKALFQAMLAAAAGRTLLDGSNLDDLGDYRPGRRALAELEISSPLLESGWTKQEIRDMAALLGLPTAQKPAMACLASRLDIPLTAELLARVEAGEDALHALGFADVRLRHHGDVARIELPRADMQRALDGAERINEALREAGYRHVALDLAGYTRGSMNAKG